uniref:Esterase 6 n=1 Tax=Panonychus citri TaxID=50023 RepID=I1YD26_PANCT|nr:esterase 6 [Panonychus citri]
MLIFLLVFCVFSLLPINVSGYHHPHRYYNKTHEGKLTVTIPWSTVIGKQERILGRPIGVFLGIPYAKPPVGQLRFIKPVPLDPHDGEYNATFFRPPCPQPPNVNTNYPETSENCLYLNVWTPVISSSLASNHIESSSLKPVIIYIYGGGFNKGSVHEKRHQGDILSSLSDTVVVTVNHRLSIFGFGYSGTESIPGNIGIYDLIQSLEWVNQNIEHFGGNPKAVTIFGACSGAMAASAFILSPIVDAKLIDKVYLASSVISPHSAIRTQEETFNLTRTVAEIVGCGNADDPEATKLTDQQVDCMRGIDAQVLMNASFSDPVMNQLSYKETPPFVMIYNTTLLPIPPDQLVLEKYPRRRVPILFGNEQNEDEIFTKLWPASIEEAKKMLNYMIMRTYPNTTEEQVETVFKYYFDKVEDYNVMEIKGALSLAAGDYLHHCPLLLYTESWTKNGQITHGYLDAYVMDGFNKSERLFGTKHGDATYQILGKAYHEYDTFSDRDRRVTRQMIKFIKSFAYGQRLNWPPMLTDSSKSVLPPKWRLTKTMDTKNIYSDPKDDICHLWGEIRQLVVG